MSKVNRVPKISIVTPSLNQGRFLQQCIDSVAAQNWPEIEHFIIDGVSTDQTLEVIERNRHLLTGFVSEPDAGAADAINKGLAKCTGDIVTWLNADDFYLPGAFEHLAKAWLINPDAGFWFGNGMRVDESGRPKGLFNPGSIQFSQHALIEGLDYILQPASFINPNVLKKAGYLNQNLRWSFDWDLWIRLAKLASPSMIDSPLAATREWESTLTANGGFKRVEELRQMAEMHSGKPITHGTLCYWLDTITSYMQSNPNALQNGVPLAINELWKAVQMDMIRLGVNAQGMPSNSNDNTGHSTIRLLRSATENVEIWPHYQSGEPMVIAVDLFPLTSGASGGIVPWVQGVLREMVRLHPNDRIIMFHRAGVSPMEIKGDNVEYVPLSENPISFYNDMTRHCKFASVNAIIRTYPQEEHPDLPFEKQVFVIPDLQHEYLPELFRKDILAARRRAFAIALSRGGAIATMTEHSRTTVLENPWTLCRDIFLMPAALPEELKDQADVKALPEEAKAFDQFFFMPANLWPHKNHRRLFEAFRLALPNLPANTGLILTGSPEGYAEVIKGFEDLPILHMGFVSHSEVAALLSESIALVYFSLFEGFGMPLLEAFHHGTPVLCSNVTSLPEVGGDAVLACDPTDIQAMASIMIEIINNKELREELASKTSVRLAAYSWTEPAVQLHSALMRLAEETYEVAHQQPLVSIVMPTRNHARFIRAAIDSVLCQDYHNIELIVMDGASTDDTVEILKSYGDRILWISEPDHGQTDAINKGMALAKGEVLAYLNSDDVLLPHALHKVVDFFQKNPECDMVYGNADYIDVDGKVTGAYVTAEYSFERMMYDCCVCQPAAFWRRRIAMRVGPFDQKLQTTMDYDYWLRIANCGGIIYHTFEKFAQSRLHEDAKTLAMRGKIFEEIFQICQRHGGYVSHNYCNGLWAYRFYEAWRGGVYLRRFLPHIYLIPSLFHYAFIFSKLRNRREALIFLARNMIYKIDRRSHFLSTLIRKVWRRSNVIRQKLSVLRIR